MNLKGLTLQEEAVVKWQYHLHGDFKTALFQAIALADDGNLERLELGFPNEVRGYLKYTRTPGWWAGVEKKIRATSYSSLKEER